MNYILSTGFALLLLSSPAIAEQTSQFALIDHEGVKTWVKRDGDKLLHLNASPLDEGQVNGQTSAEASAKYLMPIKPATVFAVGLNYRSHAGDAGASKPEIFYKSYSSLSIGGPLQLPKDARNVHFEGELVVVIGQNCSKVSKQNARECIFGYTVGNDLTERSWQGRDLQWWRAKGADGFAPISPWITQTTAQNQFTVTTKLNGDIVQQESSANMIHSVEDIISYISQYVSLQAYDVIFTGTPGRTKALKSGDQVEVSIEGLGKVSTQIE
ncbi:FAA hydrolase family protein [Agarivorans sp. B2Z047]|uniref:fumarylacetoacetate hydrolase family protein n=1 Tax=Agarivorans sp. B2Z047 TaxID=2652721 RepID=UPI00140645E3|nr:fumarylacetoacetate hydrolase family protein [Agarivorans sp. B2Z047]MPW29545.1 FAA hydrolase family protein [Agarivorans sp. B2Z047]UQN45132.1 fumarylacetoacetate hydrolase family protein [Agarivorans sp. B2Z047]